MKEIKTKKMIEESFLREKKAIILTFKGTTED